MQLNLTDEEYQLLLEIYQHFSLISATHKFAMDFSNRDASIRFVEDRMRELGINTWTGGLFAFLRWSVDTEDVGTPHDLARQTAQSAKWESPIEHGKVWVGT